jgi:two-component system sensor histidine kinase YesM
MTFWVYIKDYKFNSILLKNFILFQLLLILPLGGISVLVYQYSRTIMEDEISRANFSVLSKIRDTIDTVMTETERLTMRIISDPDVGVTLSENTIYPIDHNRMNRIHRIQQILRLSLLTNDYFDSIQIIADKSKLVISADYAGDLQNYEYQGWYNPYVDNQKKKASWIVANHQPIEFNTASASRLISYYRTAPLTGSEKYGAVAVHIDAGKWDRWIKNAEEVQHQSLYIFNADSKLLYQWEEDALGPGSEETVAWLQSYIDHDIQSQFINRNGRQHIVTVLKSTANSWYYLSAVPLDAYQLKQEQLKAFMALLLYLCAAFSVLLAFIISVYGYQPLSKILEIIKKGSQPPAESKLDELKYITSSILTSYRKHTALEGELAQRIEKLKKAQAIALQSQINPHFLFNTLETMNWKAIRLTGGNNEVSSMIQSLSRLLRLSLETEENLVELRTELDHAQLYLEMQQLRYKDKFQVVWELDPQIAEYKVIKLILQPILENAIYHGIKPADRPCIITVRGKEITSAVVLRVIDNGRGMAPYELLLATSRLQGEDIAEDRHIGLSNVHQRLTIAFGSGFGIRLRSRLNKGTIVEIKVPKIK